MDSKEEDILIEQFMGLARILGPEKFPGVPKKGPS